MDPRRVDRPRSRPARSFLRRTPFVPASAFLVLVLAACTGSAASPNGVLTLATNGPDSSAAPSATPIADPKDAMLAYAKCMRDHGIDMPDPVIVESNGGGSGDAGFSTGKSVAGGQAVNPKDDPGFRTADTACRPLIAGMIKDLGPSTMSAEQQQAFLDFSKCMREHDVPMPDPQFSGGGVSIQIGGDDPASPNLDPQSPVFRKAQDACRDDLPGAKGGVLGAPTTSSGK